jgi:GntR family transcriptional regulator
MLLNGVEAVELTDSWYPLGLARGSALASERPLRGGSPAELSRMGYESDHCTEEVTARMPTSEEVRTLSLGAGVPVLRILRTVFTGDDQRIEVMSMVMAGDRYKLFYELPVH